MLKLKTGFTLIELLVVIAIIGILSSVVLASLNTARGKGADAAIKSNLANIRAQAEIVYDNNTPNNYTGVCADPNIVAQMNSARDAAGAVAALNTTLATAGDATHVTCHVTAIGDAWLIESPLKSNTANAWCVDNTGASRQEGAHVAGGITVCG